MYRNIKSVKSVIRCTTFSINASDSFSDAQIPFRDTFPWLPFPVALFNFHAFFGDQATLTQTRLCQFLLARSELGYGIFSLKRAHAGVSPYLQYRVYNVDTGVGYVYINAYTFPM